MLRLYVFDGTGPAPWPCMGHHPNLEDDPKVFTGNPNAVGVAADLGPPPPAEGVVLEADGVTIRQIPRQIALHDVRGRLTSLKLESVDELVEVLLQVLLELVPAGQPTPTGALSVETAALLEDIRARILPELSVAEPEDLDGAARAKRRQKALTDGLPARVAAVVP